MESALQRNWNDRRQESSGIRVPAKITLYQGVRTGRMDNYRIESDLPWLSSSNVLLVNATGELCGVLNLVKDETRTGVYYLSRHRDAELRETSNHSYSLLFLRRQESEYFYNLYYGDKPMLPLKLQGHRIPVAELIIRGTETTDAVLAIDFGTSNTTAGAYLDSSYVTAPDTGMSSTVRLNAINYVSFPYQKGQKATGSKYCRLLFASQIAPIQNISFMYLGRMHYVDLTWQEAVQQYCGDQAVGQRL